jgi:hypothetical protein
MIVIGLSGKIGSGKTTFSKLLVSSLKEKSVKAPVSVYEYNFADKLKRITKELCGYGGYTQEEKNLFISDYNMTVGEILQKVGTDALRNHFDQDVWVKATFTEFYQNEFNSINIIGDCRFPNEADNIKSLGGINIRLEGDPAEVRANSNRDINHISETALDNYENFDFKYDNTGDISQLQMFAEEVADSILYRLILR